MLFSQRLGFTSAGKLVQRESLDEELRNKIWNVMTLQLWNQWEPPPGPYSGRYRSDAANRIENLLEVLWFSYFKKPLDTQPEFGQESGGKSYYNLLRDIVLKGKWYEVFDLVESLIQHMPADWRKGFAQFLNHVLESENSAYRVINLHVVETTDANEVRAVEEGIEAAASAVRAHLKRALELLTDRKSPDYRNSIKESISAVEAVCQEIAGKPSATLGQCLAAIKQKRHLHPAFEQALLKLYGFTSDSGGIRHAITEEGECPSYADAKFMLVSCSALTNYFRTVLSERR